MFIIIRDKILRFKLYTGLVFVLIAIFYIYISIQEYESLQKIYPKFSLNKVGEDIAANILENESVYVIGICNVELVYYAKKVPFNVGDENGALDLMKWENAKSALLFTSIDAPTMLQRIYFTKSDSVQHDIIAIY